MLVPTVCSCSHAGGRGRGPGTPSTLRPSQGEAANPGLRVAQAPSGSEGGLCLWFVGPGRAGNTTRVLRLVPT